MKYFFWCCLLLLYLTADAQQSIPRYTISGYVREEGSGESLIGVNVYLPGTATGTTTNNYGFYSLTLPASDTITLTFSYVGYRPETQKIVLKRSTELNVTLHPEAMLQEVEVVAKRQERVSETPQMSVIEVPVSQIKDIPALLGEKDVLKVLQLLPGVQKGSEGNSGLYVRGGGPDQNLIILDDATVYNVFHLFGFFSLFNADALKSVELTKGGFPARFGGRLSSVVEMNMKEGNKEKLHGEGGIGLISSRLTLEGPLKKEKSSFLISGRRTYIDALSRPFLPKKERRGYYFYDLNTKINYDFGRKNKLYVSGYFGQDRFSYIDVVDADVKKTGFHWGNATGTLRWNHLFNDKLFANTSLIFSDYRFTIYSQAQDSQGNEYELNYSSGIRDFGFKYDLDFFPNPRHAIKAGITSTFHRFTPSALVLKDTDVNEYRLDMEAIPAVESGLYIEDLYKPLPQLRINAGFRLSHFAARHKQYIRPEPRLSAAYSLTNDFSLKASYAQMNQYIHLISNTGVGLPTDLWVPTTARIAPQQSRQVALGIAKDFLGKGFAVTTEAYYKKSDNILGYKEGASFLLIEDGAGNANQVSWENNVTAGQGWSYGVEWLLQKKTGRISGWLGYTLSWTQLQFDSLNFGRKYYARYDRRHDLSLVGIYEISPGITLSGTWIYGTGNAITLPIAEYRAIQHSFRTKPVYDLMNQGQKVNDYGPKNSFRMAPYHRLDVGIQFHKKKKWGKHPWERTWEISVYNTYNRKNPFYYYILNHHPKTGGEVRTLRQVSLFPVMPSFSYSFKF